MPDDDTRRARPRERHVRDGRDGPARVAADDAPRARGSTPATSAMRRFKTAVARELGPHASGFLIEPRVRSRTSRRTCPHGLILAVDALVQEPGGARRGHVARRGRRGCAGRRRRAEAARDLARRRPPRASASSCRGASSSWRSDTACSRCSSRSCACRSRPRGAIVEAARELGATRPSLYKCQVPLAGAATRRDHAPCRGDRRGAAGAVGRALAGRRRRTTSRARSRPRASGGASGMLAGRAVWTAALGADDPTELAARALGAAPRSELGRDRRRARPPWRDEGVRIRGVIEGFYGQPWTHEERLDLIRFCGARGPEHVGARAEGRPVPPRAWREPYPDDELARLAELVAEATRARRRVRLRDRARASTSATRRDAELETLVAKCEQVRAPASTTFQLLWDDVEHALHCRGRERYGDASGRARRPGRSANRFLAAFAQQAPLVVCPMGYAGTGDSPYRRSFGAGARPADRRLLDRPRGRLARRSRARSSTPRSTRFRGHELLLWDNYPVNDFDAASGCSSGRCAGAIRGSPTGSARRDRSRTRWCRRCRRSSRSRRSRTGRATRAATTRSRRSSARCASTARRWSRRCARLAPSPREVDAPADVDALVDALALGVDAATALALLEPFV